MDVALLAPLLVVGFVVLLTLGRRRIAAGANAQVADGAVLLTLALVVGLLALGTVLSLDVW